MLTVKRTLPIALTIIAGCLWQRPAEAQSKLFYLDRAQISGAPDDGYMVWRPYIYPRTRFYGMLSLGYSHTPLRIGAATTDKDVVNSVDDPVQGQFLTYLNVGTQVAGWFSFNISQPISLYTMYGDAAADTTERGTPTFNANEKMGLHDTRFDLRAKYYSSNDKQTALGVGAAVFVGTGNSAGAVAGDDATTAYFYLSAEHNFGDWLLAGNIGPHLRPQRGLLDASNGEGNANTLAVGSELRWSVGAYVPLSENRYMVGAELWGTAGIGKYNEINTTFKAQNLDIEWLLIGKMKLDQSGHWWAQGGAGTGTISGYGAPSFRVLASLGYWFSLSDKAPPTKTEKYEFTKIENEPDRDGDGYPDSVDKCPDIKEDKKQPNPTDGCPADADRDGDGIPDSIDACPDVKEDKDGVADSDGCPEDDADNDGIADGRDKCPMEPGPSQKLAEKNGCPSLTKFTDDGEIQLLEPIQFETGKAVIKPVSFPILDEVVTLMKARKDLKVGVHGHTDSVGADDMNMMLSKNRAASCVKYLVEHGIASSRLQSEGFGETKPISTNDTAEGRAKNRRTEFKVLQ
jgi:outer membrane protein OmpA-like peptidoglycan-associated protein